MTAEQTASLHPTTAHSTTAHGRATRLSGDRHTGYDEQWQRHLEKAYFEKQALLMRSVGGQSRAKPGEADDLPFAEPVQWRRVVDADHRVATDPLLQQTLAIDPQSIPVATLALPGISKPGAQRPDGVAMLAARVDYTAQTQATARQSSPNKTLASGTMALSFEGVLPDTSSVKALVTPQGIHLVVRDTALQQEQVLTVLDKVLNKVLNKLRELLGATHQRLWAITLNGERLWQNTVSTDDAIFQYGDLSSSVNTEIDNGHRINKFF